MENHYIVCIILLYWIKRSFGSFCDTTEPVKHAFNVGYNVYIDNKWFYDVVNKKLMDNKYEALWMFANQIEFRFKSVKTGFSVIFDDDCMKDERGILCDTINSVKNVVIVIGMIDDKPGYGCFDYSKPINDLQLIEQMDLPWGLKTFADLDKNFIKMPKNFTNNAYYESMVLVPKRRQLLVLIFDGIEHNKLRRHYLYSKTLEDSGKWSEWKQHSKFFACFLGLFHIDNRVFGVNYDNDILEFIWDDENNMINTKKISNIKEFFKCSKISIPTELPLPSTPLQSQSTTITTKVISESTTNAKAITTTNTKPILISETTKTPKMSEKPIKHTPKVSVTKQTPKQQMVTNSESISKQKSKTLSMIIIIFVVILLIVFILTLVILIIFWQKSKKSSTYRLKLKKSSVSTDTEN